ncbi:MAG: V-type ATP synthase subunit E [Treponema sp.]|nr:V-type ATP synthase subunit E [Treponema sp.]
MDIQVQELINKIKKDGVESATEEATRIRHAAEAEAKQIVDTAKKEAAKITEKARQDAERSEKAGVAALEQASRNLLLVFRGEVQALLDKIVQEQLKESYNDDVLKKVLPEMLSAWSPKDQGSLDLLLGESSLDKLRAFFEGKLAKELKKGLELRSDAGLSGGFRIANRDGSAYYDFSADSVAEMLCAYLNPRLAEILRASVKGE